MNYKNIIRIFVFIFSIVIIDFFIGHGLSYLFKNQKKGIYYRVNYGVYKSDADVFIFGSSNANHHIVPSIIEQETGCTAYNMGRDGMDILYHYSMFKGVLVRHKPKKVILCLSPLEFSNIDNYDRLANIIPYISLDDSIKKIVYLKSRYEKYKLISKIYPYNSTILNLINGFITNSNKKTDGYVPIYGTHITKKTKSVVFKSDSTFNIHRIQAFENFILLARENNIEVFIIMSPWYKVENPNTKSIERIRKITEKHSIPFFNYTLHPNYSGKPEKFFDEGHLNHENAVDFTKIIVSNIF